MIVSMNYTVMCEGFEYYAIFMSKLLTLTLFDQGVAACQSTAFI